MMQEKSRSAMMNENESYHSPQNYRKLSENQIKGLKQFNSMENKPEKSILWLALSGTV